MKPTTPTTPPNEWAAAAHPGDPLAHLRWWCDASGRAAKELDGVLGERDRLRAELAAIRTAVGGYADIDDADDSGTRTRTADAVYLMWDELRTTRAEVDEQKAMSVKLAERLRACSEVLGRAAERGKFDLAAVVAAQAHKGGIEAVMGQWPGDETDEEIAAALRAEGGTVSQGHTEGGQ